MSYESKFNYKRKLVAIRRLRWDRKICHNMIKFNSVFGKRTITKLLTISKGTRRHPMDKNSSKEFPRSTEFLNWWLKSCSTCSPLPSSSGSFLRLQIQFNLTSIVLNGEAVSEIRKWWMHLDTIGKLAIERNS